MSTPSAACWLYQSDRETYLRTHRLFYLDPSENPFEGWYFKVRGPRFYGPYQSRKDASRVLSRMIREYCEKNDSSGR
nr:hypothetical protein [uncultured bacterium]